MKISARDIQLFVGGALAITGFRALIWLPYYLAVSLDSARIAGSIITGLALPIGIGILVGRVQAVSWALIYLWLVVISGFIVIPAFYYALPSKIDRILWATAPEMLVSIALLVVIYWSRSRRFRHEPDA
jgi:hypothetical protein